MWIECSSVEWSLNNDRGLIEVLGWWLHQRVHFLTIWNELHCILLYFFVLYFLSLLYILCNVVYNIALYGGVEYCTVPPHNLNYLLSGSNMIRAPADRVITFYTFCISLEIKIHEIPVISQIAIRLLIQLAAFPLKRKKKLPKNQNIIFVGNKLQFQTQRQGETIGCDEKRWGCSNKGIKK